MQRYVICKSSHLIRLFSADEVCVQTESGSTCKATFETKSEQPRPLVRTAQAESTSEEKTFSSFEFGISIAMTFFGTVLLGILLYLIRESWHIITGADKEIRMVILGDRIVGDIVMLATL